MRDVVFPSVVGGDAHRGGSAAMVRVAQRNDIVVACVGTGQEESEFVSFRARVYEVTDLKFSGHAVGQFFPVLGDARVKINGGGMLEEMVLFVDRGDHLWVAVSDGDSDDTAKSVEIAATLFIEQVLHRPLHEHEWLAVVMKK